MLLRMQRYKYKVSFRQGKDMLLADTLVMAHGTEQPDMVDTADVATVEAEDRFENEFEAINAVDGLPIAQA